MKKIKTIDIYDNPSRHPEFVYQLTPEDIAKLTGPVTAGRWKP